MNLIKFLLLLLLIFSKTHEVFSQEEINSEESSMKIEKENKIERPHYFALLSGQTYVFNSIDINGKTQGKIIPSVGFDYVYLFNEKFALGTTIDFELDKYIIKTSINDILERENAFLLSVVGYLELKKGITFFTGPGYEFEKNKNFWVAKFGFEFMKYFDSDKWRAGFNICGDLKEENSTITFALSIARNI